jgi:hypothetical protein
LRGSGDRHPATVFGALRFFAVFLNGVLSLLIHAEFRKW